MTRRLAAILIADVVGYTRLMERDDTGTFSRLRTIRDEVVDPVIVSHGGRIVKTAGDGLVAEFASALAALRGAVEVQREMAARNADVPTAERIEYRIGINLGDIMVESNDIAGDGVNVASRLEALAQPGGICVSSSVREQVHGNLDIGFDDIGDQQVKNIARPIRAFAVRLGGADVRPAGADEKSRARPKARAVVSTAMALPSTRLWTVFAVVIGAAVIALIASYSHLWPFRSEASPAPPAMSVGVMPLVAPSADAAMVQRAEAWTRDITSMLIRSDPAIRAVPALVGQSRAEGGGRISAGARAPDVRYLLEGEVRHREDATLINLHLTNVATGEQVSSETVSLKPTDNTHDQMRALRAAVQHLRNSLSNVEVRRVMTLPPGDATALDYVLRARALLRTQPDTLQRAREQERLYEEALRRDPNLVPALVGLFYALDKQNDNDLDVDHDRMVRRMDELTSRAVNLNGAHPWTWEARANALMYMGQWDAALEASAKEMRLDPDESGVNSSRAWLMSMSGRPSEAQALTEQAIAADPPGDFLEMRNACEAHLLLGQYEQAIAACDKAKGLSREDWSVDLFLVAAYAHQGDIAKAAAAKAEVLRRVPGYTIAMLKSRGYSLNPDYVRLAEEHWYSGLRKAGFPER